MAFVMAASTGIAAFFLLRIVAVLFPAGMERRRLWIGIAFVLGMTGAAGRSVIGSTMNEWPVAALLIAAISVLVASAARDAGPSTRAIAVAGLLAGMAAGLKLTYGVFAAALFVAALSFGTLRERTRRAVLIGCALAAGFLLTYGFWGAILYREFGNPFFPYFNDIFKSPWWEPVAFLDRNFGPRTVRQALVFPLYFAWQSPLVGETSFRDGRLAVLFAIGVLCLIKRLREGNRTLSPQWRLVVVFTLVAYLLWVPLFSIYRYLVPLEMLSGALIVGGALYLGSGKRSQRWAIAVLAFFLLATTLKGNWGRIDFRDRFFEVSVPSVPAHSLVIVGPWEPMAYIVAFFPADTRFVSPFNNFLHSKTGMQEN